MNRPMLLLAYLVLRWKHRADRLKCMVVRERFIRAWRVQA